MNCWEVLGIEPTKDKRKIKQAYASLIKKHHPEDDPEGYNKVRNAYDLAMNACKINQQINYVDYQVSNHREKEQTNSLNRNAFEEKFKRIQEGMDKQQEDEGVVDFSEVFNQAEVEHQKEINLLKKQMELIFKEKKDSIQAWTNLCESQLFQKLKYEKEVIARLLFLLENNPKMILKVRKFLLEKFEIKKRREVALNLHDESQRMIYQRLWNHLCIEEKPPTKAKEPASFFLLLVIGLLIIGVLASTSNKKNTNNEIDQKLLRNAQSWNNEYREKNNTEMYTHMYSVKEEEGKQYLYYLSEQILGGYDEIQKHISNLFVLREGEVYFLYDIGQKKILTENYTAIHPINSVGEGSVYIEYFAVSKGSLYAIMNDKGEVLTEYKFEQMDFSFMKVDDSTGIYELVFADEQGT